MAAEQRGADVEAFRLFHQAADRGDARAEFNLGQMVAQGQGAPLDYSAAAAWYRKAADQGNAGAQFSLGLMYQIGQGVPHDDREALAWYLKAAGQGFASAQVNLASMYANGDGAPEDGAAAAKWYGEAAEQGDPDGEFNLGLIYAAAARHPRKPTQTMPQDRFHVLMDSVFGVGRWRETGGYRSVARENQLRAQGAETVPAGVISRHSQGTPNAPEAYDIAVDGMSPDQAAAVLRHSVGVFKRLFPETTHGTQGAHLHVEPGLIELGAARLQRPADETEAGSLAGVRTADAASAFVSIPTQIPAQDFVEAAVWFLKAAAQGNAGAQFNLALLYQNGQGVPQDASLAIHWYLEAARRGDANAQMKLGVMYASGDGVPQNETESIKWLDLAAANVSPADADQLKAIVRLRNKVTAQLKPSKLPAPSNAGAKVGPPSS